MFLALDISSKTGWAAFSLEHGLESGRWNLSGGHGERFVQIKRRLHAAVMRHSVDVIGIELKYQAPDLSLFNAQLGFGLPAQVKAYAFEHGLPEPDEITPQAWRSTFMPNWKAPKGTAEQRRKATKDATIRRCEERGWFPKNDDEADALGILDHLRRKHDEDYAAKRGVPIQQDFLELMMA